MLSEDELARLRDHAASNPSHAGDVVLRLVAEVERLRAREAGLVADLGLAGDLLVKISRVIADVGAGAADPAEMMT